VGSTQEPLVSNLGEIVKNKALAGGLKAGNFFVV
jgi:hypothetical protein